MVFANCMTVIAFTVRGTQYIQVAEIHPPRLWGTPPISRLPRCARARRYQYQVWDIWNGIYAHERGHSWKINAQLKA